MDTTLVVELHVPLLPSPDLDPEDYQFPWIEEVYEILAQADERGEAEMSDDGEEIDDEYVFFLSGAPEEKLLALASRIAELPGVPGGAFAVVTDDSDQDPGSGRRVELLPD